MHSGHVLDTLNVQMTTDCVVIKKMKETRQLGIIRITFQYWWRWNQTMPTRVCTACTV